MQAMQGMCRTVPEVTHQFIKSTMEICKECQHLEDNLTINASSSCMHAAHTIHVSSDSSYHGTHFAYCTEYGIYYSNEA